MVRSITFILTCSSRKCANFPLRMILYHLLSLASIVLLVCPTSSPVMSRKRRAPASFDWKKVSDDNEPQAVPDIRIQHTHLNLDQSRPPSTRTSYIPSPASPSKAGPSNLTYDDFNWNEEPAPPEINFDNYPFLDPAYVHHLDANEPGPPRRKRTTEVCVDC